MKNEDVLHINRRGKNNGFKYSLLRKWKLFPNSVPDDDVHIMWINETRTEGKWIITGLSLYHPIKAWITQDVETVCISLG